MKKRLMEFSFKKMVIEKESKEVEIKGNLTLFLELFLELLDPLNAVSFLFTLGLFLLDFSAWIICGEMLEV